MSKRQRGKLHSLYGNGSPERFCGSFVSNHTVGREPQVHLVVVPPGTPLTPDVAQLILAIYTIRSDKVDVLKYT